MLTSHCTSLELSLALREAGYPQENALCYWYRQEEYYGAGVLQPACEPFLDRYVAEPSFPVKRLAAAPLASELLVNLPKHVKGYVLQICPGFKEGGWFAGYGDHMNLNGFLVEDGDTLTEALGKLWKHLRQEQLI